MSIQFFLDQQQAIDYYLEINPKAKNYSKEEIIENIKVLCPNFDNLPKKDGKFQL